MQHQGFISVPFKTESAHGLTSYNGVAKFSPAGIVLEFESKIFGLIPGGVKEVRLPIGEILDIKFKKGFLRLGAKIVIRTKTFAVLAAMPNDNGRVTLKLIRDDFELGRSAVDQIHKDMSGYAAELPPPRTPVGELFGDESEDETRPLSKSAD
ncbi:MAG: hypothetical protein ABL984_12755 [Pyrinomonadaceae bacterium]